MKKHVDSIQFVYARKMYKIQEKSAKYNSVITIKISRSICEWFIFIYRNLVSKLIPLKIFIQTTFARKTYQKVDYTSNLSYNSSGVKAEIEYCN